MRAPSLHLEKPMNGWCPQVPNTITAMTVNGVIPGYENLYKSYSSFQPMACENEIIVVFPPSLYEAPEPYLGFTQFWKDQLLKAIQNGSTVFIFLSELILETLSEVKFHNYQFFPGRLPLLTNGSDPTITHTSSAIFDPYWEAAHAYITPQAVLKVENLAGALTTADGLLTQVFKSAKGHIVMIPPINWEHADLMEQDDTWTPRAEQLGVQVMQALISAHKLLNI